MNPTDAFIVDGTRTPFGRFAGALSAMRTDDLAAHRQTGPAMGQRR